MKATPLARPYGTRVEHLANTLTLLIATRELRPGDRLHYEEIESRYGVSRTVVREALRVLEGKGLVEARPHVGTRVADAAGWNILDLSLLRAMATFDDDLRLNAQRVRDAVETQRELNGASPLTDYLAGTIDAALAAPLTALA